MTRHTWRYASVTVTQPDGSESNILVPTKGRVSKKKVSQAALHYAQTQLRVRDAWRDHLTEEHLAPLRESLISTAASYAALQLVSIGLERFGEGGLTDLLADVQKAATEDKAAAAMDAAIDAARERMERVLRDAFEGHPEGLDDQIRGIEYNAVTAVLLDFEEEHADNLESMSAEEYDRLFDEALDRDYGERRGEYAVLASQSLAQHLLEALEAGTAPLAKLLTYLGIAPAGEAEISLPPLDLDRLDLGILAMQPAQTIDRAARGPAGWQITPDRLPRFTDPRSALFVEYRRDGDTAEALAEAVNRLNPRTADVWRLMTARSLEAWRPEQDSPPGIWLDVRELANAMGYKKHHKGGYRPEHLSEIANAVHALDAFHITLPLGTEVYQPAKAGSRRRAPYKVEAVRTYKVLHISARDEIRNLFGERYELRYELKPGDWIKHFPRTYAPLFKALVELPAKAGANTWAKAIGTELVYQYRQDAKNGGEVKVLKVRTLLERAVLLEEATSSRNKGRSRTYFEDALDILKREEVCAGWEYEPDDADNLEAKAGARGWVDVWLECRVRVTVPDRVTNGLQATSNAAKRGQQKRSLSSTR